MKKLILTLLALPLMLAGPSLTAKEAKGLKALMITGGCCHDYNNQKGIISNGVSDRLPVEWTIFHDQDQNKMKDYLSTAGWADGYDFVLYNHCFAHETDAPFVKSVADVHAKRGLPALFLHCAMHSYHWKIPAEEGQEKAWPTLLGVSSKGHGPKAQITVTKDKANADHPVTKDLPEGWVTPEGELYNVQKVLDGTTVLAWGNNGKVKQPQACIWVSQHGKAKVFGTTIGHHNSTMQTKEYLDLVANGVRWVLGK